MRNIWIGRVAAVGIVVVGLVAACLFWPATGRSLSPDWTARQLADDLVAAGLDYEISSIPYNPNAVILRRRGSGESWEQLVKELQLVPKFAATPGRLFIGPNSKKWPAQERPDQMQLHHFQLFGSTADLAAVRALYR